MQERVSASQIQTARRLNLQENPITTFDSSSFPVLSDLSPLSELSDIDMPSNPVPTTSATVGTAGSSSGPQLTRGAAGIDNPISDSNPRNSAVVSSHTSTRKMPKPGEKNAPTFDPEKPEDLGRFFERIEDWFADEGIRDDTDKKKRIVKYLDTDSESQWKAQSKFLDGSFEEFKKDVMASYPRAEEVMKGSVSALKKKIKKIGPVAVDERDELLSLVRTMTAEVLKLKSIQPPIHTNRELVDLFLARLTPDFAGRVANKLSVHRLMASQNPEDDPPARNTEDMYDIEDVMKMAKHTSLENANPFGKYLHGVSGGITETNVKLEEAVARLSDSLNVQTQYNKQVDQRLASMQSFMNQPRLPVAQPGYSRGLAPTNNYVSPNPAPSTCFYCRGPHRIAECEHAMKHQDMKLIVRIDGYLRLPDGRSIPRDGTKTLKEVVESLNQPKPGIIPMSKIQDKTALYQGSSKMSSYVQSQSSEEDNMRALLEIMQKVGVDKIQEMLHSTSQEVGNEESEEWNQNFDLAL